MILNEKQENSGMVGVGDGGEKEENKVKEIQRDHYICTDNTLNRTFSEYFSIFILNSCHTTILYFIVVVAMGFRMCAKIQLLVQCSPYP